MPTLSNPVATAAARLGHIASSFSFSDPIAIAYNPLDYALPIHLEFAQRYGNPTKKVLFVGMNPGPFGMMQTGIPFGEIAAVQSFLHLNGSVTPPDIQHPKRRIEGFQCKRSEVSGRRLWGLFAQKFGTADAFFKDHYVLNYCPLAFLDSSGRNLTPDKFKGAQTQRLFQACDQHLREVIAALQVQFVVGVGDFAEKRIRESLKDTPSLSHLTITRILHPSPANPAANRDWAGTASQQLKSAGIW